MSGANGRDAHVGQSGSSQSADDGGLGALRRRHPGDRFVWRFFVGARAGVACGSAHSTWHLYRKVVEPDLSPRQGPLALTGTALLPQIS